MRTLIVALLCLILCVQMALLGMYLYDKYGRPEPSMPLAQQAPSGTEQSDDEYTFADSASKRTQTRASTASQDQGLSTQLRFEDQRIYLSGDAPSHLSAERLRDYGHSLYVTQEDFTVRSQAAPHWLPSWGTIIAALPDYHNLHVSMTDRAFVIHGQAKHRDANVNLASALQRLPQPILSDIQATVAPARAPSASTSAKPASKPSATPKRTPPATQPSAPKVTLAAKPTHEARRQLSKPQSSASASMHSMRKNSGGEIYWPLNSPEWYPQPLQGPAALDPRATFLDYHHEGKRLRIWGSVPSKQSFEQLRNAMDQYDLQTDLRDLEVQRGATPPYWSKMWQNALQQLPKFHRVQITWSQHLLDVQGHIRQASESAIVLALLENTSAELKVQVCFKAPPQYLASDILCTKRVNELLQRERLEFLPNSDQLHWSSEAVLDTLSAMLKSCPSAKLQLSASQMSATLGPQAALSWARKHSVAQYLLDKGIPAAQILKTSPTPELQTAMIERP